MQFSIDTTNKTFLVGSVPRAETRYDNGEAKMRNGLPVFALDILAMDDEGVEKIRVKVAGKPEVAVQTQVRLVGFSVMPWEKDGKRGAVFFVDALEPAGKLAKAS